MSTGLPGSCLLLLWFLYFPAPHHFPMLASQALILGGSFTGFSSLNSCLQEPLVQWDVAEAVGHLHVRGGVGWDVIDL